MADEATPADTTSSATDAPAAAPAEQPTAPVAEAGDGGAEAPVETSVLGDAVATPPADAAEPGEPGEPAAEPAPEGPPEAYALTLEGVPLDAESVAEAEPIFRELGLTNEQANKFMPVAKAFADRTAQATVQQLIDAGAQQRADWLATLKADDKIGGAKFDETVHFAAKALDTLGYPVGSDFRKALTETGFGNHPEMARLLRTVGEMVGEDGFARSDASANPQRSLSDRLYSKG